MTKDFSGVSSFCIEGLLKTALVLLWLTVGLDFNGALAQQSQEGNKKILIEYADLMKGAEKSLGKNTWALVGNVRMKHLNTRMFCDSAVLNRDSNRVEAFGSIHIIQNDTIHLYGDRLDYEGNEELAKVRDNVRMVN